MTAPPLLVAEDVCIDVASATGRARAVDGVSLQVHPGECVAIVGESGGGKSLFARALVGLLPTGARQVSGTVRWRGLALDPAQRATTLGGEIGYVPQEAGSALDPSQRIGAFLAEGPRVRSRLRRKDAERRAIGLLDAVGIADPATRARQYPHQLSVGTRQRVLLAAALSQEPALVIADEPTSAVDATIAAELVRVIAQARAGEGALLLVTHDLGVVAALADRVAVMYAGRIVERASVAEFFATPRHPYSQALLAAVPSAGAEPRALPGVPPSPGARPSGCAFHPRCPLADDECVRADPPLTGDERAVACWKVTS